jgi:virulence plasmid B protein
MDQERRTGTFGPTPNSTTTGWTVTDKTGKVYTFGTTTSSQLYNGSTKVYRWMLDSVRDTNGNYMVYTYYQDSNLIYPNAITYTYNATSTSNFEIDFTRASAAGIPTYFYTGFSTQRNYHIDQVQMKVNGSIVSKYLLSYSTRDNGHGEVLNSVVESGTDESGNTMALPLTRFDYQTLSSSQKGWTVNSAWVVPTDFTSATGTADYGARFGDVNGDGVPDLLRSDLNSSNADVPLPIGGCTRYEAEGSPREHGRTSHSV